MLNNTKDNLLFIRSKIQFFESKSQLLQGVVCYVSVVYQIKDTIFWKQITTNVAYFYDDWQLFIRSKIQFFESKSQPAVPASFSFPVVYQIKDTIFWKQITTFLVRKRTSLQLFIRSKIQFFESKSQLCLILCSRSVCCLSDQRYNFLKANHNRRLRVLP